MWTPRRISLGLFGLVLFAAAYFGYARLLGNLDGLPPLPAEYQNQEDPGNRPLVRPLPGNSLDRKLELAFGQGCPELRFPIKVEMKGKGVILASYKSEIIKTGERAGGVGRSRRAVADSD